MDCRGRIQFTLLHLLLVTTVLAVLTAIFVPPLMAARKQSAKSSCSNSLKQLANYLTLYVSRYGGDRDYPITVSLYGSGVPVPAGSNGAFWSWLYRVPEQERAVSKRPGDCGLYVCRVRQYEHRSWAKPTSLDYTGPNLGATWPPNSGDLSGRAIYPGGILSEAVRGDVMIAGDIIGPPDVPNHGGAPGAPNDDWKGLCFDGHVESVVPHSEKAALYALTTAGVRTR